MSRAFESNSERRIRLEKFLMGGAPLLLLSVWFQDGSKLYFFEYSGFVVSFCLGLAFFLYDKSSAQIASLSKKEKARFRRKWMFLFLSGLTALQFSVLPLFESKESNIEMQSKISHLEWRINELKRDISLKHSGEDKESDIEKLVKSQEHVAN